MCGFCNIGVVISSPSSSGKPALLHRGVEVWCCTRFQPIWLKWELFPRNITHLRSGQPLMFKILAWIYAVVLIKLCQCSSLLWLRGNIEMAEFKSSITQNMLETAFNSSFGFLCANHLINFLVQSLWNEENMWLLLREGRWVHSLTCLGFPKTVDCLGCSDPIQSPGVWMLVCDAAFRPAVGTSASP